MEIITGDIGGTNARFAIAEVVGGRVAALGECATLHTADHASLATAFQAFAAQHAGRPIPRTAGIAVAAPIAGDVLKMTNNPWVIRPATLAAELGLDRVTLVNDFGAVGHAVGSLGAEYLRPVCGPDGALPDDGVIGIVGPGTGLGVAHVLRIGGRSHVIESEGGHIDFAPVDSIDDALLARMRAKYRRVSVERVVSGPGLANIFEALAALEGRASAPRADAELWQAALSGADPLAETALQRLCMSLGSVCGDIALATGASFMVIGGGVGARLGDVLPGSGFAERFTAKGRMEAVLSTIPVRLITHPQPGLFGAAAAVAAGMA
jgi:glucokinase